LRANSELISLSSEVIQVVNDGVTVRLDALRAEKAQTDGNSNTDDNDTQDDEQKLLLSHGFVLP
jgi:hypothetical protein